MNESLEQLTPFQRMIQDALVRKYGETLTAKQGKAFVDGFRAGFLRARDLAVCVVSHAYDQFDRDDRDELACEMAEIGDRIEMLGEEGTH